MGAYAEPWVVNNSSEAGAGTLSLTSATTNSTNAVYAQLALDLGPENVADMAKDLGITSPLEGYPAETIGGLEVGVSPLEMSNAYATFGNGGVHNPATAIAKVEFPNGDVDEPDPAETNRALTEGEAYEVTRVLETVVDSGTGTAANYGCSDIAGKTGTTDENTDAWFVGYTPNLSTAVWIGYPDDRTVARLLGLRRHLLGADLERVHVRRRPRLRVLRRPRRAARPLELLRRARRLVVELGLHHPIGHANHPRRRRRPGPATPTPAPTRAGVQDGGRPCRRGRLASSS